MLYAYSVLKHITPVFQLAWPDDFVPAPVFTLLCWMIMWGVYPYLTNIWITLYVGSVSWYCTFNILDQWKCSGNNFLVILSIIKISPLSFQIFFLEIFTQCSPRSNAKALIAFFDWRMMDLSFLCSSTVIYVVFNRSTTINYLQSLSSIFFCTDGLATGSILLDSACELQQEESCSYFCTFIICSTSLCFQWWGHAYFWECMWAPQMG